MRKMQDVFPIALLILTLILVIYNLFSNSVGKFWAASAVQLLTPLTAICLAFFATQMKNDQREAKKHAESIANKIQSVVIDEHFYIFPDSGDLKKWREIREEIQIRNRKMSNAIDSLMKYGKALKFETEAAYIKHEFDYYRDRIDATTDFISLSCSRIPLKKYAENIASKCDQIIVKLYCP